MPQLFVFLKKARSLRNRFLFTFSFTVHLDQSKNVIRGTEGREKDIHERYSMGISTRFENKQYGCKNGDGTGIVLIPLEFLFIKFLFIKFVISISIRDSKSNMKTSRIEMQIIRKRKISSGTHAKTDAKRIRDLQMILTGALDLAHSHTGRKTL